MRKNPSDKKSTGELILIIGGLFVVAILVSVILGYIHGTLTI
tara:strand:+ start:75 stop:200 length:126 start_codon:yes stop_codon:yes gene_type:complete